MKKGLTTNRIRATVDDWPTRYPQGLTRSEILSLLEELRVNESLFWEELGPNTVIVSESGETVTYHVDIKRALVGLLNDRSKRSWVVLNSEGDILTYSIKNRKLYEQWWTLKPELADRAKVLDFLFSNHEISDPIKHERRTLNHWNSCRVIRHKDLIELGTAILSLNEEWD
jgi:hypothetical protein